MQERELVAALMTKDSGGINALAESYGSMIRYIIRPILKNPDDEEMCYFRVIENITTNIHRYDLKSENFAGWVTSVAHDTARSFLPPVDAPDPSGEQSKALDTAIEGLSHSQKIFFYRRYYYMQSEEQMAGEMNSDRGINEKWLGALRQKLKPYVDSGMSDGALDKALTKYAHGVPPKKIVRDVNPWRSAMDNILLGLCASFGRYDDMLELIGMVCSAALLFSGCVRLRQTNRFFNAAYYFSLLYVGFTAVYIGFTPGIDAHPAVTAAFSAAGNIVMVSCFLSLFFGIRHIARRNSKMSPALPLTLFAVMYVSLLAANILGYDGRVYSSLFELAVTFIALIAIMIGFFHYVYKGRDFGYDIIARAPKAGHIATLLGPIVLCLICAGVQEIVW